MENDDHAPRVDIVTRDGETFAVLLPGKEYQPDILHVVVYDAKKKDERLVALPFHVIERVEIFTSEPGEAQREVGFQGPEGAER